MAESSRRYNLRDTRKKPQGVLLKRWEMQYSNLINNENRRIPLETVKTAIRSAFEDGMFEQWRITLKCQLSGQRIKVPARYADCTHIECFDLEAFLRMKTQKNLMVCPICQKEVEKLLASLRIDKYIETVLSTLPDAMQVELLPDGSFTEVFEELVVAPNVINDEEPYVQDSNTSYFDVKQEVSEDDEYITLSDGEDESLEEIAIVDMKPISLMPLNMDIKPMINSSSQPEQIQSGEEQEIQRFQGSTGQCFKFSLIPPEECPNMLLQNEYGTLETKTTRVQQAGHSKLIDTVLIEQSSSRLLRTTPAQVVSNISNMLARKMKITKIGINIGNGSVRFETAEGKCYHYRPLREYLAMLCQSEADDLDCEAHIIFRRPHYVNNGSATALLIPGYNMWNEDIAKCRHYITRPESITANQKKFENFSKEIHSIAHLWENGRVMAELFDYSKYENEILPLSISCGELFSQDRSILRCKLLKIQLADSWPMSVVTNAAHRCNQLILKEMNDRDQRLHYSFLDTLYGMKIPQNVDITLELNFSESAKEFIGELKKRFQRSTGQHFKFQLLSPNSGSPDILLRNYYGTFEMKTLHPQPTNASHSRDRVLILQR